ncbi:MAG: bi-domain-containing oxidoreductase [Planctomycetota bacterium]
MKEILQDLKTGAIEVADVPCPKVKSGHLLIQTEASLISSGTERMLVEFGRAGFLGKALQQPGKARETWEKIRTDGLWPTLEAIQSRLDRPLALGYANAGRVLELGPGVRGFAPGDRVVSNGPHAEVVSVPQTLAARIPPGVAMEEAPFAVLAAIALQGIRLAGPTLGERFVVTGLGLVGLLTVELLRAQGCQVLGIDYNLERLKLAQSFGAKVVNLSQGEDSVRTALAFSEGRGVDGVILAASTRSSEPVHEAAEMCRRRGRIVLVGVTGLELQRADFYEKELSFQVSSSYGPGRHDASYEELGRDYPFGHVRWTAQRNIQAALELMKEKRLSVSPLVSHRFPFEKAPDAYALLLDEKAGVLGILLQYPAKPGDEPLRATTVSYPAPRATRGERPSSEPVVCAFIGAGNHACRALIPAFRRASAVLKTVASRGGVSSTHAARRFGFESATSEVESVFHDPAIRAVVIATRHDSHADLAERALLAGKHVFVEKPLAVDARGLSLVEAAVERLGRETAAPILMVGFNRRFAPHVVRMKSLLDGVGEPKALVATVNAGALPPGHWTNDPEVGGGRIVGEACHFIDLLRFLVGWPVLQIQTSPIMNRASSSHSRESATLTMTFADGSIGTVHYLANGHKSFPKERIEAFAAGRALVLDNFRSLRGYGWPRFHRLGLWRQDKGHAVCAAAFIEAVRQGACSPIAWEDILETTRLSLQAQGVL